MLDPTSHKRADTTKTSAARRFNLTAPNSERRAQVPDPNEVMREEPQNLVGAGKRR